jgi:multicomponent Na+:H+ antiporter subunit E
MATRPLIEAQRLQTFLLINVLIAVAVPWIYQLFGGLLDHLVTFVFAYLILGLIDRAYLRAVFWGAIFLLYFLWQVLLSNVSIAWLVIQPRPKLDPGIVAVPLTIDTGLEITMLASAISLTPGTLSIDLGTDDDGNNVLYVHNLRVGNAEEFRASVHNGFERLIMRIFREV